MPRLIFIIAIGVAGWLIYKLYYKKLQAQGKPGMIKLGLIALGLVFMVAAVTGKAHFIFALIGAAMTMVMRFLPLVLRFAPSLAQLFNKHRVNNPGQGQQSKVQTAYLDMTLDHDSGQMSGHVLSGQHAGRQLDSLSPDELRQLFDECTANDPESARLLQAWVARTYSDEGHSNDQWREAAGGGAGSNTGGGSGSNATPSITEARDILGLDDSASRQDVVDAHRRLMIKMHPDKGGSNYLAAKINAAKEVLLKHVA